jgi:hypothetical protein
MRDAAILAVAESELKHHSTTELSTHELLVLPPRAVVP